MKILFITRKYPPQIGGMEKYSYNLIKHFPAQKQVIFLNRSQWHLIWWLPRVFLKTFWFIHHSFNKFRAGSTKRRAEGKKSKDPTAIFGDSSSPTTPQNDDADFNLIYLCDSLLAPLGHLLKKFTKLSVAITCHGLDVVYPHWWYQKIVIRALKKLDKIICVSRATLEECAKRGVPREKLVFIPNGVEIKPKTKNQKLKPQTKNLKINKIEINFQNKNVLLTVGRLVKRKGVAWFCENVITKTPKNIVYLVIGSGPEKQNIKNLIEKNDLKKRAFLLGKLSNEELEKVYQISDIFIMPNIKVFGDMEGFGLVALEAANYGLPVIASDLEGISDAIKSGENGILVKPNDAKEFIRQINILLKDQEKKQALILRAKKFNQENFNWKKIAKEYYFELTKLFPRIK